MALCARSTDVCAGQGEIGQIVIKSRRRPGNGIMALGTRMAELITDVIGIIHIFVIVLMT